VTACQSKRANSDTSMDSTEAIPQWFAPTFCDTQPNILVCFLGAFASFGDSTVVARFWTLSEDNLWRVLRLCGGLR